MYLALNGPTGLVIFDHPYNAAACLTVRSDSWAAAHRSPSSGVSARRVIARVFPCPASGFGEGVLPWGCQRDPKLTSGGSGTGSVSRAVDGG